MAGGKAFPWRARFTYAYGEGHELRRLLTAVVVAAVLLALSPGRAGAAPPTDPPLVGPGERLVLSMTKTQIATQD
jgi:hypothetical protein